MTPLLLLALMALSAVVMLSVQASSEKPEPAESDVWDRELAYWKYLEDGDIEGYMELWHDEFVGWPNGLKAPTDKPALRAFVSRIIENLVPGSLHTTLHLESVRLFGKIGIVYYTVTADGTFRDGSPLHLEERITHTWRHEDGNWVIIGGMAAPMP